MLKSEALCTNCAERKVGNGAKGLCPNCYGYCKRHNGAMRPHRNGSREARVETNVEKLARLKALQPKPVIVLPGTPDPKKHRDEHLVPASVAIGGWKIDKAALRRATRFLKLEHSIRIKRTQGRHRRGSAGWRWDAKLGREVHVISISTYLSPQEATVTLWHELCHAAQREYEGVGWGANSFAMNYVRARKRYGYRNCPYEVEARAAGDAFAHIALVQGAHR